MILGLDLGLSCSAVAWDVVDRVRVGAGSVKGDKLPKGASFPVRMSRLRNAVDGVLGLVYGVAAGGSMVVVEDYSVRSVHRMKEIAEFGGAVRFALLQRGYRMVAIDPSSARSLVLCREAARWRKEEVVREVRHRQQWAQDMNPDEIDASVMLLAGRMLVGLPSQAGFPERIGDGSWVTLRNRRRADNGLDGRGLE